MNVTFMHEEKQLGVWEMDQPPRVGETVILEMPHRVYGVAWIHGENETVEAVVELCAIAQLTEPQPVPDDSRPLLK